MDDLSGTISGYRYLKSALSGGRGYDTGAMSVDVIDPGAMPNILLGLNGAVTVE